MATQSMTLSSIWNLALKKISNKVKDRSLYNSFFSTSYLFSLDGGNAVLVTDSAVSKKVLTQDYSNLIIKAINDVTESDYSLSIITANEIKQNKDQIRLTEEKKSTVYFESAFIQPKFTFENFVVGKSNQQAYQSALYVSKNPGSFNPLFLYSRSGLGKTHLLHAIGNAVHNDDPNKKVLYITSEDFVDEFVKYIRGDNDRESLKDFFKNIDFLLIDDIQFLTGKQATTTMFFNIFNLLVSRGKQIVITSDRSPSQLEGLEERLVSRFSQGLSVNIEKPEKTTLIEILIMKIQANGFDSSLFDDDALEYIAENNSRNIRELEGALNRILFFNVSAKNTDRITLEIVHQAFSYETKSNRKKGKLNAERIIYEVAKYYNLADSQIKSRVRTLQIALARAIAMYLCRNLLDMSFAAVGKAFNGKDHTTVMAACKKVENLLKTDSNMKKAIKSLTAELKN
ncbi:MAG: chromosomal replication initiator protein DnaA [Bacilli bacterium]